MKKLLLLFCLALFAGHSFAQKWDKLFQDDTYSGSPIGARDMVEYGGDLYVAGTWNSTLGSYIAKWDGTSWSAVGSGFIELNPTSNYGAAGIYTLEVYNGELYAGGYFALDIGGTTYNGLAKWNGTNWSVIPDWPLGTVISDLALYNGNIMIGGKFSGLFGGATTIDNVIGFDGTNWVPFNQGVWQGDVFTMDVHNNELYIAGKFYQDRATNAFLDNFAKWDDLNSVWVNIGAFATLYTNSGYIDRIQSYGSHLYVYTLRNDIFSPVPRLLRWDLSTEVTEITVVSTNPWSHIARLDAMTIFGGNLIVSGVFYDSQAGGNAGPIQIESYDGTSWNKALPSGASAVALGVYNGKLTNGTLSLQDPSVEFVADKTTPCIGEVVNFSFTEVSSNPITSFTWTFEGGTPATSTNAAPAVTWAANGNYNVSIAVTSTDGTNTVTTNNYIRLDNTINITTQPVDVMVCEEGTANFFIVKDFGANTTMQWQVDDGTGYVNIVGAESTSYTIPTTLDLNGNKYQCKVNRCGNVVISSEATLTVNETPKIITQPVSQTICVSGDATFVVETEISAGAITYQWQYFDGSIFTNLVDGGVYAGTTTNALTITGVDNTLAELYDNDNSDGIVAARYKCIISANGCDVSSVLPNLFIIDAPTITANPEDVTGCDSGAGFSTSFSITPSVNTSGINYQWQVDDGNGFVNITDNTIYGNSKTKTLSLTSAPASYNGFKYRCEVGACSTPVVSAAATLNIDAAPVITQQPVLTNTCEGSDVTFIVEATGTNLLYQWQVRKGTGSFEDILSNDDTYNAFDGSLTVSSPSTAMDNYSYKCVISSGASCSVASSAGRLDVYSQPTLTLFSNNQTTVCDGESTWLKVTASSTTGINAGIFTYQWQIDAFGLGFTDIADDNNYSGSTTNVLSIDVAPFSFNGSKYRCIIRGCTAENASATETLIVLQLPLVTTSPQSQTVCAGEQVTFTALATGSDLTYTWWKDTGDGNFTQVTAANANPEYKFAVAASFNGYKYKCIATAGTCSTTAESLEATLTVHQTEITAVSEQSLNICAGETASFSVTMSNEEGLSFQWSDANGDLTDGDLYAGVTTSALTVSGGLTTANNIYSVSISGDCGNETASFQLLVNGLGTPAIEAQFGDPSNPQIVVTNTGIFSLGVDNFEWFLNGTSYQNTGSTPSVTIDQAGSYTVVATRTNCEFPESNAAVVVITGFENGLNSKGVSVYPNPVNNKLTLEMGNDFDATKESKIVLTNTSGKQVFTKRYNNLYNRKMDIDMSGFESGIYVVSVINGDNIVQYKITKQ